MARKPPGPGAPARGKRMPLLVIVMHGKPRQMPRAMTRSTIRSTKKPSKSKR
jgi:hypothetical protein